MRPTSGFPLLVLASVRRTIDFSNRPPKLWSPAAPFSRRWSVFLPLVWLLGAVWVGGAELVIAQTESTILPQTSITEVKRLTATEARKARLVRVIGTTTFSLPGWPGFLVQDADAGIYCDVPPGAGWPAPGESVEIEGFTAMGNVPYLRARSIKSLGKVGLPSGERIALKDTAEDVYDGRRVRVQGMVHRVEELPNQCRIRLTKEGIHLEAMLHGAASPALKSLLHSEVECVGTLGRMFVPGSSNMMQFISLQGWNELRVLRPPEEVITNLPVLSLAQVRSDQDLKAGTLVRTRGKLSLSLPPDVWLSDGTNGLLVNLLERTSARPEELLEVVGFLETNAPFRRISQARQLSAVRASPHSPRVVAGKALTDPANLGALVAVEGEVLIMTPTPEGNLYLLAADDIPWQARLKFPSAQAPEIPVGSRVQMTGVLYLEPVAGELSPICRILVPRPSDIQILAPPRWSQAKTLSIVTGLSVALGLGFLLAGVGFVLVKRAHRRALSTLADRESRLKEAQRIGRIGSWGWEVATGANLWSEETFRLLGLEPNKIQPSYELFCSLIHPEDRERVVAAARSALDSGAAYEVEYRIVHPQGETRYLHCRGEVTRDASGRALRLDATVLDITDRKRAELKDRLRAKALEALARGAELKAVMDQIVEILEGEHPSWKCSVMLSDPQGQRLSWVSTGRLPGFFSSALSGLPIAPEGPACGGAAFRKSVSIVPDICTHEDWRPFQSLADRAGLRSCWCQPIVSSAGAVLGLFSVYHDESRSPTAQDLWALADIANLASIAIEYRRNEEARRESERGLEEAQAIAHVGSFFWNARTHQVSWSKELFNVFGRHPAQFKPSFETYVAAIYEADRAHVMAGIHQAMATREPFAHDYRALLPDGTTRWLQARGRVVADAAGEVLGLEGTCQDITERKQLEEHIRHSQKMEAIGTLAGGIAHDFNNLLGSILGYAYLAKQDLTREHPVMECVDAIEQAGNRAKSLVRQILSFSRPHDANREVLQLGPIVAEAAALLRATLPAGVELVQSVATDLPNVLADPNQIHQVVVNLCTNAWHALEDRPGRIEIQLRGVSFQSSATVPDGGLRPGRYVCLSVTDTGHGMEAATLARIFDPFFTTKEPGKGTGLGLAVVHGIVGSHDGVIRVSSQPQHGTTFHIYFPAVDALMTTAEASLPGEVKGRGERVLFLDDEAPLTEIATRMLKHLGYEPEVHTRQEEALKALGANPEAFRAVITDLNMPGSSGLEFAHSVWKVRPGIPIILSSGHITEELLNRARGLGIQQVLNKPTTIEELGECLARMLRQTAP